MGEPSPLSKFFPHLATMPQHPPHPHPQHPVGPHVLPPHLGGPHPHYQLHPSHVPPMPFNPHPMHMMGDPRGLPPMGSILPLPSVSSPGPLPPPGLSAPQMQPPISSPIPASAQHHRTASPARPSGASAASRPSASSANSTPSRSKKPQQQRTAMGERLPAGAEVTYQMESQRSARGLEVTPITLLNTPLVFQRGNLIAVNQNYICYVVKGNMIRVINILSAKRALLRGHTKNITDLQFCPSETDDILASVGADGRLFVWRILDDDAAPAPAGSRDDDAERGVGHELVVSVRMSDRYSEKVVWHPGLKNLLATAGNDQHLYLWDLNRIRQQQLVTEDDKKVFVYSGGPADGVIPINVGAAINDLAFASTGNALAAASSDGRVQLWAASDGAAPSLRLSWLAHENEAWGVAFHPDGQTVITGGQHNAELGLWQLGADDAVYEQEPVLLQRIRFSPSPSSGGIYNHIALEASGAFLFVANAKSTTFMVLHIQTQPQPRFDYISEFPVTQNFMSFTVLNREPSSKTEQEMDVYCMQTKGIQMYHVTSGLCYAPPPAGTPAAVSTPPATPPTSSGAPAAVSQAAGSLSGAPPPAGDEASTTSPAAAVATPSPPAVGEEQSSEADASSKAEPKTEERQTTESESAVTPASTADGTDVEPTPEKPAEASEETRSTEEERPSSPPQAEASPAESTAQPEENGHAPQPAEVEEQSSAAAPAKPDADEANPDEKPTATATDAEAPSEATTVDAAAPAETQHEKEEAETATLAATSETTISPSEAAVPLVEEKKQDEEVRPQDESKPEAESQPAPAEEAQSPAPEKPVEPSANGGVDHSADHIKPPTSEETAKPAKVEEQPIVVAAPAKPPSTAVSEPPAAGQQAPSPSKPASASPAGRNKQGSKKQPKQPKSAAHQPQQFGPGAVTAILQSPSRAAAATTAESELAATAGGITDKPETVSGGGSGLQAELRRMEASLLNGLSARVERTLQQHVERQAAKADKERQDRDKAERDRQGRLVAAVTQAVSQGLATVPQQVERAVQKELQASLVPAIGRLLVGLEKNLSDSLKPVLLHAVADAASNGTMTPSSSAATWSHDLPPRLAAEVASRLPSANDIAAALQASVRHSVEASFRASFQETIIPSFQGSCQTMFQQIYGTVLPGLQQTVEEAVEPGLSRLTGGLGGPGLADTLQALVAAVGELQEATARNTELVQAALSAQGPGSARLGLQPPMFGLEHHQQPQVSEAQLMQLLEREAYEQAFALALSERGAEAVGHLLQWIEPQGFFESGHGLSQVVMASLIHRVALDLHHGDTPLKLDWLSHLLLHFHPADPSIAAHAQHILHHTSHHLNLLLAAHPPPPLAVNAKLLLHTANSLLSSVSAAAAAVPFPAGGLPPASSAPTPGPTPTTSFSSLPYTPYL